MMVNKLTQVNWVSGAGHMQLGSIGDFGGACAVGQSLPRGFDCPEW